MADVEVAICVWRTVVEHKRLLCRAIGRLPLVQVVGASSEIHVSLRELGPGSVALSVAVFQTAHSSYGNEDLGSRRVDAHDFDMLPPRHCLVSCRDSSGSLLRPARARARPKFAIEAPVGRPCGTLMQGPRINASRQVIPCTGATARSRGQATCVWKVCRQ
jgi:hypothetical protein